MASSSSKGDAPVGVQGSDGSSQKGQLKWFDVIPKSVSSEDSMTDEQRRRTWTKLYALAGKPRGAEGELLAIRAAVYVYGALNGTSREGNYAGTIITSDGHRFSASVIPEAAGSMSIRKFFRSNMDESYDFFKSTSVMELNARFVAKAAKHSIAASEAFATADWLTNCPRFTPLESRAHDATFKYGVTRANNNRGGRNLEQVEESRIDSMLNAQVPAAGASVNGDNSW